MFLASKPGTVHMTFADALAVIRKMHTLTLGMQQIVYLVGWQFDGHDSKYPAWSEVNHRLKREQDATARDSLVWLMREAARFNTVISLHINMDDAYTNSPLWDDYVNNDLLIRNEDGSLAKGGVWDGEQSYLVSKKREWESGFARKRIDALLEMLPLAAAGTVHIDVFAPRADPYHGITWDDEVPAMVEVLRYWRSRGVDVTKEWFHDEFVGLVPMAYHLNLDEARRLKYPAELICGGGPGWNQRSASQRRAPPWWGFFCAPSAGCLYEEPWGQSMDEDVQSEQDLPRFRKQFFLRTLPFQFLNRFRRLRLVQTKTFYRVLYSDAVQAEVRVADNHFTLRWHGQAVLDGTDMCLPIAWQPHTLIAYSQRGCNCSWPLPTSWREYGRVTVSELGWSEQPMHWEVTYQGRALALDLAPDQAVSIALQP